MPAGSGTAYGSVEGWMPWPADPMLAGPTADLEAQRRLGSNADQRHIARAAAAPGGLLHATNQRRPSLTPCSIHPDGIATPPTMPGKFVRFKRRFWDHGQSGVKPLNPLESSPSRGDRTYRCQAEPSGGAMQHCSAAGSSTRASMSGTSQAGLGLRLGLPDGQSNSPPFICSLRGENFLHMTWGQW